MRRPCLRGGLVPVVLLGGCTSFSTHLSPRPTTPGILELQANIDFVAATQDDGRRLTLPSIELAARYGLSPIVDIGAKLNGSSAEINSRIAFLQSDDLDIGIVPSVGGALLEFVRGHPQRWVLHFGGPVLFGIHLRETMTLILGAKAYYAVALDGAQQEDARTNIEVDYPPENTIIPGVVTAFELRFSKSFAFIPEVNALFPYLPEASKFARPVFQAGLAFQFRLISE